MKKNKQLFCLLVSMIFALTLSAQNFMPKAEVIPVLKVALEELQTEAESNPLPAVAIFSASEVSPGILQTTRIDYYRLVLHQVADTDNTVVQSIDYTHDFYTQKYQNSGIDLSFLEDIRSEIVELLST
jgi:hypothetical protein